jgi:hypothetical protein
LPFSSEFRGKVDKMKNSGVVSFTVYKCNDTKAICIDEDSMQIVYGGFEAPKKAKAEITNKNKNDEAGKA